MATQGDVKPLGQYTRDIIYTSDTLPKNIAAGTASYFDFPIAKSGKTPVGIVGVTGSGTGAMAFEDLYIANETTARLYCRNVTAYQTAITALHIDVLYRVD